MTCFCQFLQLKFSLPFYVLFDFGQDFSPIIDFSLMLLFLQFVSKEGVFSRKL